MQVGQGSIVNMTSFTAAHFHSNGDRSRYTYKADKGNKFAFVLLGSVNIDVVVTERHFMSLVSKIGCLTPDDTDRWSKRIDYLQTKLKQAGVEFETEENWLARIAATNTPTINDEVGSHE